MHLIKALCLFKKNLNYIYYIFSNIVKMCLSSSFIVSSSLTQLSAVISVLLAAITHFTQTFVQHNKLSLQVSFTRQI